MYSHWPHDHCTVRCSQAFRLQQIEIPWTDSHLVTLVDSYRVLLFATKPSCESWFALLINPKNPMSLTPVEFPNLMIPVMNLLILFEISWIS